MDALISLQSWYCITHTVMVNYVQECGFNLNEASDGEDRVKLGMKPVMVKTE
jgi:hypothetical protein